VFLISTYCISQISFCAGGYGWSDTRAIRDSLQCRVDLDLPTLTGEPGLVLSMRSKPGEAQSADVCVFSKGALVDRSGLGICVRSPSVDGRPLVRKTYRVQEGEQRGKGKTKGAAVDGAHGGSRYVAAVVEDVSESTSHSKHSDKSGVPVPVSVSVPLNIERMKVKSRRRYLVTTADVGDAVYTDRDLRWTQLPHQLRGQVYICPPCEDRSMRAPNLLEFVTNKSAVVFVLYDIKSSLPPHWLVSEGYRRIAENGIARRVAQGTVLDHTYVVWGKGVSAGSPVSLGSASKDCRSMYAVFVVPADSPRSIAELLDQTPVDVTAKQDEAQDCWIHGGSGITLFHAAESKIAIGILQGTAWCEQVNTKPISSSKGLFEIVDKRTNMGYQLAYKVTSMPVSE